MTQPHPQHVLSRAFVHHEWDAGRVPAIAIEPPAILAVETRSQGIDHYTPDSTAHDVLHRPKAAGLALTGPIRVEGARPGDTLQVDILDIRIDRWGYTAVESGFGLLEEIAGPIMRIWDLSDGRFARLNDSIAIPIEPSLGTIGVAPADPSRRSTIPPWRTGGNLDIKQLGVGSTLWLPVEVEGAMLSIGDAHAAQGDGEVCGTAIETESVATVRVSLQRGRHLSFPQFRTAGPLLRRTNVGPWHGTTGVGPDLMLAARDAIRAMVEFLGEEWGLSREDAYVLCSLAVDLKISEAVDRPNWVVSALLPLGIRETG